MGCPLATQLWLRTVERRLQVLWALLAYGQQDAYSVASNIAVCFEKEPMALLPGVHANAEALERLWLVEATRPGVYRLTPLGVLVAWRLCSGDYCSTLLAARELERGESLLRGLSVAAALAYVLAYSEDPAAVLARLGRGGVVDHSDPVAEVVLRPGGAPLVEVDQDYPCSCMDVGQLGDPEQAAILALDSPREFYEEAEHAGLLLMHGRRLGELVERCRDVMRTGPCEPGFEAILEDATGLNGVSLVEFAHRHGCASVLAPARAAALAVASAVLDEILGVASSRHVLLDTLTVLYNSFRETLSPLLRGYIADVLAAVLVGELEQSLGLAVSLLSMHPELAELIAGSRREAVARLARVLEAVLAQPPRARRGRRLDAAG
ncbi:hypothetical protein [Pyrodictium abyssi]|uniref:Transcriptional regulator n=1 Tax=Pyrodictium abyssi TaxID=54256 RepID=A0ABM8IZ91_9CREN|nr:hypothetical protein PABY_18160 [Pyrodictium abyssi]